MPLHCRTLRRLSGPLEHALAGEAWVAIRSAFAQLPERQRMVVLLRDVEGTGSDEVRDLLGLSAGNQRVLLHRGRARLRQLLGDADRRLCTCTRIRRRARALPAVVDPWHSLPRNAWRPDGTVLADRRTERT